MKQIKEKGYEHYLIDINGNVFNTKAAKGLRTKGPRLLKSYPNKNTGYMTVVLRNGIKAKAFYVHRLVGSVYISNPLNLPEINHKDSNKNNNSVYNLEWVTRKQNLQHRDIVKETKLDIILKDKEILNKGIEAYKMYGTMKYAAAVWKCSIPIVRKILINNGIEIYRKNTIPLFVKNELIKAYSNNPNWKRRHLKKYALDTYSIKLKDFLVVSIMKNNESLFSITKESKIIKKNIVQKTVLDFCFDI